MVVKRPLGNIVHRCPTIHVNYVLWHLLNSIELFELFWIVGTWRSSPKERYRWWQVSTVEMPNKEETSSWAQGGRCQMAMATLGNLWTHDDFSTFPTDVGIFQRTPLVEIVEHLWIEYHSHRACGAMCASLRLSHAVPTLAAGSFYNPLSAGMDKVSGLATGRNHQTS